MQLSALINPSYIYKKRDRIAPVLYRCIYSPVWSVHRHSALSGFPITSSDRKFLSMKNKHQGQRCFIIGNGPSLRIDDLERLHELDEICFAFNKIYLAFDNTNFRPSYYIVEDLLVASETKREILDLENFQKFFPYDYKYFLNGASNSCFYYFNWANFYPGRPLFTCNPFDLHWGATVTYTALQFAIYFGCNPIYLLGVDFFFVEPKSIDATRNDVLISEGEQNHFHPGYRCKGEKWYAPKLDHQKKAFEAAQDYSESHGIRIINATRNTQLDVFEQQHLLDIIGKS